MEMISKLKYRSRKSVIKNGAYRPRTCRKTKLNYHKHNFRGETTAPRYTRQRGC